MKHKIMKLSSLILVPLLFIAEAQATIYKCVNTKAEVYYNDKPCLITDEESQINAVKDPEGGYIPPDFVTDNDQQASNGAVIGSTPERKINKTENDTSDNTNKTGSSSTASSSTKSSSKKSKNASKTNSQSNSNSDSSVKNGSTNYQVKNVIHKEGDYKKEGK